MARRADEEDAAADRASSDKARELHHELATRYRNTTDSEPASDDKETGNFVRPKDFRILD